LTISSLVAIFSMIEGKKLFNSDWSLSSLSAKTIRKNTLSTKSKERNKQTLNNIG